MCSSNKLGQKKNGDTLVLSALQKHPGDTKDERLSHEESFQERGKNEIKTE
jgi:hypothetical protein